MRGAVFSASPKEIWDLGWEAEGKSLSVAENLQVCRLTLEGGELETYYAREVIIVAKYEIRFYLK